MADDGWLMLGMLGKRGTLGKARTGWLVDRWWNGQGAGRRADGVVGWRLPHDRCGKVP